MLWHAQLPHLPRAPPSKLLFFKMLHRTDGRTDGFVGSGWGWSRLRKARLTWIRWGRVIVVPDTRIGNAALGQRRTAHARSRGARNGRRGSAGRTVRATAGSFITGSTASTSVTHLGFF